MEIPYVLLIFLTYPLEFPQICFKIWTLPWKFLHFWFTFAGGHWKFHMSSIGGGGCGLIMRSANIPLNFRQDLFTFQQKCTLRHRFGCFWSFRVRNSDKSPIFIAEIKNFGTDSGILHIRKSELNFRFLAYMKYLPHFLQIYYQLISRGL